MSVAAEFARKWYSRAASGCDEDTLAMMLEGLLESEHRRAREEERMLITRRLTRLINGEVQR